ncbi:MAG TPA: hypothetical protein VNN79_21640 [Actinomycetota bacterium]|nr:hypothetical protein [Actinomycetota bacterium]
MFLLVILAPLLVAAATSLLLVRRDAAAAAGGTTLKHPPRAAGFGQGGMPVPVEPTDSGLAALLEPPLHRPWWLRILRVMLLAVLLTIAAAVIAAGIYELGKWAGEMLKRFATGG